jgi:hypothetical protein
MDVDDGAVGEVGSVPMDASGVRSAVHADPTRPMIVARPRSSDRVIGGTLPTPLFEVVTALPNRGLEDAYTSTRTLGSQHF